MDSRASDRVLGADEIEAALAAHGFGGERPASGAVVLALNDPLRVVWANRSAVEMFGADEPAELFAQVFAGPGRDGLAAAVRRLAPGGGAKAERLRLFRGFRARTLTVTIGRTMLSDGEDLFLLAIPTAEGGAADAADFAVSALRLPPTPAAAGVPSGPASDEEPPSREVTAAPAWLTALGTKRFVWQTDAAHRIVSVTAAPPDLMGLGGGGLPGRRLVEVVAEAGAEPADALEPLLATLCPWRGLTLNWPLALGGGAVPVTFGAVPIKGAGGEVTGFRGFGAADFAAVTGRPPLVRTPTVPPPAEAAVEPVEPVDASPTHADAARPEGMAAPPASSVRASFSSAKVVALRPFQVLGGISAAPGEPASPPARRYDDPVTAVPDAPPPVNLSSIEHFNFHEIGRTLKGEVVDPAADDGVGSAAEAGLLSALPVALLLCIGDRPVFSNQAFCEVTGYGSPVALERAGGLAHLMGGLDLDAAVGDGADRAFPIVTAAGAVLLVEGRAAPVVWSGAPARALTLRRAADAASQMEGLERDVRRRTLEASEARALLDRVSDAVATVDGQGRLLMLNKGGEALFGLHETGAVGESIGALLSAESQSAALGAVLAASAAGPAAEPAAVPVSGLRLNGGVLSLAMAPRALAAGKVGVVFRDMGALEGLRRDVRRLQAELDHGTGVRADFLSRVSHEIRTPLNAILGFAEIILDERFGPIGNPRYKDYLTDIHAAGKQVIDYVGDLHDLSKMQAGRLDLAMVPVDVNRIVGETVSQMQAQAHRDRVIVRLSLMQHLPQVLVDERALRQIMSNILANAIAFNEPGGQVIVSTAPTDGGIVAVRVRDTGVGMSETELATVLEPIKQISLGRPGSGSGLGLPLTHALVEANQATMSIQSRKNEGTLVEIGLRQAPAEERSNPAA